MTITAQTDGINLGSAKELTHYTKSVTGGTLHTFVAREGADIKGVSSAFAASAGAGGVRRLPLTGARTVTGVMPTVAAQANIFGITFTPGTAEYLVSEAANNNTKTDVICFEHVLSDSYAAGANFNVVVNAHFVIGSGTLTTKTVAVDVYKCADDDTQGSTIETTAAQTITGSAADYTYAVTGTGLNPGDRVVIKLTMVLTETASSNVTGRINSVRLTSA
jgi:hypothetical protein